MTDTKTDGHMTTMPEFSYDELEAINRSLMESLVKVAAVAPGILGDLEFAHANRPNHSKSFLALSDKDFYNSVKMILNEARAVVIGAKHGKN